MNEKKKKKTQRNQMQIRSWLLLVLVFFLGFLLVVYNLFQIQIVKGSEYRAYALQQGTKKTIIEPQRGSIYDRNEKILAQSAMVWNVCIAPSGIPPEEEDFIASNLSRILEVPQEDIKAQMQNKNSDYARVKMRVDNHVRQDILDFIAANEDVRGIFFEQDTKRYYTYDHLASTLLGFTNYDSHGAYGLESYYDTILSGTPGVQVVSRNTRSGGANSTQNYKAQDGHSIVLTIDETVQAVLEKHLEMAVVEHGVKNKATGIVMNMKTGEILGMATKPDFNPNFPNQLEDPAAIAQLEGLSEDSEEYKDLLQELRYDQWRNKAISDPYEPGSVYKIITAAIALEEDKSFLSDTFYCSGSIEVADRTMNCWWKPGHGAQNFVDIMRNSCNPAFITLGLRNGAEITHQYMTDFGFGRVTGIDLPGEAEGILHSYDTLARGGSVQLASTSFGQSFKTTPIQLITAISAAVSGGNLVEPYVVRQIMDAQGNIIETIQPNVKRQVISKETSEEICLLVEAVVAEGSGRNAAIPGYRIGGKTGTSEKLDLLPAKEYVLSFSGFAPMEDPTYACLVLLDEPLVSNPWGSVIAAPVVGAIFQEILPYLGVEPHFTPEELAKKPVDIPYLIGQKPHDAQAALTALGIKTRIIGQGSEVVRQIPLVGQSQPKGGTVTLYCAEEELNPNLKVPDLLDMTLDQALAALSNLDLNIAIQGDIGQGVPTIVGSQWPLPDEKIMTADVVTITMVRDTRKDDVEELPQLPPSNVKPSDEPATDTPVPEMQTPSPPDSNQPQDNIFVNPSTDTQTNPQVEIVRDDEDVVDGNPS